MLQSIIEPFFPTSQFSTQFSAMGYLLGRFEALPNSEVLYVIRGQLHLNDGLSFKASMRLSYWHKLSQQATFCADDEYLWRIYFRTNEAGKLTQVQLIKCIPIDFPTKQSDVNQVETAIDLFRIRGRIADSDDQKIVLRLERNDRPPDHREKSSQWQPFFLTVWGSEPSAHKGQFWDLLVTRDSKCLKLTGATLISEAETPSNQEIAPNKSVDSLHFQEQSLSSSTGTIMIKGKQPEMTVKFTTRPELPEQGKTVTLEVTGDNGITVRATLNRKTLAKQVQKMDSFADWVAALSGKVGTVSSDRTISLDAASVTVFEKKPKTTEPVSDDPSAKK